MRKIITLTALGLVLAAGYGFASNDSIGTGSSGTGSSGSGAAGAERIGTGPMGTGADAWLPMDRVAGNLIADGYRPYEIEIDDGYYEVEAFAPDGRRVEIYVHPVSGAFLKVEPDD